MKLLRSKKGFTLVEIIVVLVIIAILAAISLPALTGYIKDANDKAAIAEARTVLVAMQTISSQEIAVKNTAKADVAKTLSEESGKVLIKNLTGMTTVKGITIAAAGISDDGAILEFVYGDTSATSVTYKNGVFTA